MGSGWLSNTVTGITDLFGKVVDAAGNAVKQKETASFADAQAARVERTTQLMIGGAVILFAALAYFKTRRA